VCVCMCVCVSHNTFQVLPFIKSEQREKRKSLSQNLPCHTQGKHTQKILREMKICLWKFSSTKSHTCVFLADSSFPELQMSTQSQTYNIFGDEKRMYYGSGRFVSSPQLDQVFYGSSPPLCRCKRAIINPRCASMR